MKSDEVYLRHVLDAVAQIEAYTVDVDAETFLPEPMRQDAVPAALGGAPERAPRSPVAGDRRPPQPHRARLPERGVQVLWEILRDDLPVLRRRVEAMLGEPRNGE